MADDSHDEDNLAALSFAFRVFETGDASLYDVSSAAGPKAITR